MDDAKLRAWWSHKQELNGSLSGQTAAEVLRRSGWARSVAGAGPYLALFSRAGLRREEIDRALAKVEIHELPSARGCTYVLPASDYALGLKAGQSFAENEVRVARKLGVTDGEIEKLRDAVATALAKTPLDPDALKAAVGDAARSLGPEGVKKGITTTVPLVLGLMQAAGEIRRIPVNGRLDQQRYKYARWEPNPLSTWKLSVEETFIDLARHFFDWTGGATVAEFQSFSGLGVRAAKAAIEPLNLEKPGEGLGDYLFLPEDREAFEKFRIPEEPQYRLVSSLDNIGQLRRDLKSLLTPEDAGCQFVHTQIVLAELPSHGIVDRGRLVGFWEYDATAGAIAWMSFTKPDREIEEAVRRTEAFIREDLGDARAFSLDSPKSRMPRIEALRKAATA